MDEREAKWVSKDEKNKFSIGDLIDLHGTWTREQISHLEFFYKYQNLYSTLLLALITAYIGMLLQFYDSTFILILIVILISMIILSLRAKISIDRYYRRYLESVVHIAKLENLLLIDKGPMSSEAGKPPISPWPSDENFIVKRFIDSRFDKCYTNSEEWVNAKMKLGDIKRAKSTFEYFTWIAAIFLIFTFFLWISNNWVFFYQVVGWNETVTT